MVPGVDDPGHPLGEALSTGETGNPGQPGDVAAASCGSAAATNSFPTRSFRTDSSSAT
ncbi:hypothetical protein GCM10010331_77830 [Streptomyces xanthochromogenes]|nr:hypothetical protein GCM10010331_77830 [Streptomyces xanthochromogenes]